MFQNPSAELAATTAGQAELHKEVAGLGTTLADGHNVLLMAVGASRTGKTLTLIGEPDQTVAAAGKGFFVPEASRDDGGASPAPASRADQGEHKKASKKGKGKGGGGGGGGSVGGRGVEEGLGDGGGGIAAKATSLAGIFPRLLAETFATLNHRVAQCAFVVWVSAAAVSISAASSSGIVESLMPPAVPSPPVCGGSSPVGGGEHKEGELDGGNAEKLKEERDPDLPPRAPPEDGLWGRAVAASSPQEVMEIVADVRSRAVSTAVGGSLGMREDSHFLLRIRVELVNRSTNEAASCQMVIAELAEEKPGEAWPAALAEVVRAHAAATAVKGDGADGLLGMIRGCLTDTAKVFCLE